MVFQLTQNCPSSEKSTWAHILSVGQVWSNLVKLGQTWSKVLKVALFGTGRYNLPPLKKNFDLEIRTCVMEEMRVLVPHLVLPLPCCLIYSSVLPQHLH